MTTEPESRDRYEAERVWGGFFGLEAKVSMPDGAHAGLSARVYFGFTGSVSTADVTYAITHTRMKSSGRDVARYVTGGIHKNMPSVHLSDFERGREYFLCLAKQGWMHESLVLIENGSHVGEYDVSAQRCIALMRDVSRPMALLSLWIAMFSNPFGGGD